VNVCFFSHVSMLGGGELWVLRAAARLARAGHGVSVACPYRSALFDACLESGLDVHGCFGPAGTPFQEPLLGFLRARAIDVVYVTVVGAFCESAVLEGLVRRLNETRTRPAIVVLKTGLPPVSGLEPEHYGWGAGPAVRRLHVVSDAVRDAFLAWAPQGGTGAEFVETRLEGVDLERFDPARHDRAACRDALGLAPHERAVTTLARLHPMKGLDNLLLAWPDVRRRVPDARLLIAGEGEERGRLESLATHLGLDGTVRFLGQVADTPRLLAASDLVCHPSLNDGLPNAVVEALAMDVPVVASAVGGLPELLDGGAAGRLIPPHDIRALERALGSLLADPAGARALAEAGRRRVRSAYSLEAHTAVLAERLGAELAEAARRPAVVCAPPPPPRTAPTPVLFLLSALRTGGEETEVAILARYLDRRRFRPLVLTAATVDEAAPAAERLQRAGIVVDEGCHALGSMAERVGYVLERIRAESVRVVVACQDTLLAYHVFQHLRPDECRLVEHAGVPGELCRIPKDRTARAIGVSRAITEQAAALLARPTDARFLPAMVDLAEMEGESRAALREAWGFGDDVIALFVGRLDAKKSVEVLIDAAARLLPSHPRLRFLVVGGPDALQPDVGRRWMADAQERCGDRFAFVGPRSDVNRLLVASDLLVLPAHGEGMSHVVNEAGAAGLPVVAADDGAAREQLEDGHAGLIVPWNDAAALAAAIAALSADPALRERLGGRLRARVHREYAAHRVVPQWEALFAEVAAEVPPVAAAPAVLVLHDDPLPPFPLEIQIETNTACNATCVMCPYPEVTREVEQGRMDQALYEGLLDQCAREPTLWRIEPFLNNEPFTDVRMVDWIALAKRTVPHAMVTVTTNGSLLFPKVADRLARSGLDGVWFSVNGASRETYEKIMGLDFDQVMANIDYLLSVRPPELRVFVNMIETEPMRGEIAENIARWQARGVVSGSSPLVNRAGNVRNFEDLRYRPVAKAPVRICDLLYHKMYVGWNGDVLLCCMDWRRRVVLGNARRQSLRDIWHGPAYSEYRRLHEAGRVAELELCRDCTYVRA
jgi:radical SAM protein with 4Fe4S-binding SPASM domain